MLLKICFLSIVLIFLFFFAIDQSTIPAKYCLRAGHQTACGQLSTTRSHCTSQVHLSYPTFFIMKALIWERCYDARSHHSKWSLSSKMAVNIAHACDADTGKIQCGRPSCHSTFTLVLCSLIRRSIFLAE